MRRNQYRFGVATAALLTVGWTSSALAIDLDALEARGEVYVVALYSEYQSEADNLADDGRVEAAEYLRGRAHAIEEGAEMFPNHPMAFPTLGENEATVLDDAFQETYALVGSEAADMAPDRIAAVQIAYEKWLFSSAEEPDERFVENRLEWTYALNRFVNWSQGIEGPALSANTPAPSNLIRVSARSW